VTHPFHALAGERLEILYTKRRGGGLVFVCARDVSRTVTLPQAWTDRGQAPAVERLSGEGLGALRELVDALVGRGCQGTVGTPHWRTVSLPAGGQHFSPVLQ
jgi:hypothetical protein